MKTIRFCLLTAWVCLACTSAMAATAAEKLLLGLGAAAGMAMLMNAPSTAAYARAVNRGELNTVPAQTPQVLGSQPQVSWMLAPVPADVCNSFKGKDGVIHAPNACAVWTKAARECILVTTETTSHHVIGALFQACQRGGA